MSRPSFQNSDYTKFQLLPSLDFSLGPLISAISFSKSELQLRNSPKDVGRISSPNQFKQVFSLETFCDSSFRAGRLFDVF